VTKEKTTLSLATQKLVTVNLNFKMKKKIVMNPISEEDRFKAIKVIQTKEGNQSIDRN
tara:strand:- start:49 stop:222 length:174 start_codon:yes stop_codon:yes gene_type:complete